MSTRLEKMMAVLRHTEGTMTFKEYADNLVALEKTATQLVMGDEFEEGMRIEEAIARLEYDARKAGVQTEQAVKQGIKALKTMEKETRICRAGISAEWRVIKRLKEVTRPDVTTYRNVYVFDDKEETELDNIVLTKEGIIILEVKGTKEDVTITNDGRLVRGGNECYGNGTLVEKMKSKRKLLQKMLETALEAKGLDIPVVIDSFIVFSAPRGIRINVTDKYHKEKYCFKDNLAARIDSYAGYAWYSKEQLEQLDIILQEFASVRKGFEHVVDLKRLCKQFVMAMELVYGEEKERMSLWEQIKNCWSRLTGGVRNTFCVAEKNKIYTTNV